MKNMFNILANDTAQLEAVEKTASNVFEQQIIARIQKTASKDVFPKKTPNPAVIRLASDISNMEILLSEAGQSFPLSSVRTQPDYGASEVNWVVGKLKRNIPDKHLRRAVNHLITGSEVTHNRQVFLDIMRASIFVVNYEDSLVNLIGYAKAFKCKSIYELGDLFNFHIIPQDYSHAVLKWFYNNTSSVQRRVI